MKLIGRMMSLKL